MKEQTVFTIVGVFAVVVCGIFLSNGFGDTFRPDLAESKVSQTTGVVPFTELIQSTQSHILTRTNYRITSADDLDTLWALIDATGTPPTIDFSTHEVLAVFAGQPESSAIQVSKVEDTKVRQVLVTIVMPGKGCVAEKDTQVPYELVTVPNSTLTVTHEDIVATTTCAS